MFASGELTPQTVVPSERLRDLNESAVYNPRTVRHQALLPKHECLRGSVADVGHSARFAMKGENAINRRLASEVVALGQAGAVGGTAAQSTANRVTADGHGPGIAEVVRHRDQLVRAHRLAVLRSVAERPTAGVGDDPAGPPAGRSDSRRPAMASRAPESSRIADPGVAGRGRGDEIRHYLGLDVVVEGRLLDFREDEHPPVEGAP